MKNLSLRQWWEMRRAECPIAETFKIKQWKTQQMALHKPDVSLGKESKKINLSGFPFFPWLGSLIRYFLEPYMLLDCLYHWAAQKWYTFPLQTSPQHSRSPFPTHPNVSKKNPGFLSPTRRTTALQEPLPHEITSTPNHLKKQKAMEKQGNLGVGFLSFLLLDFIPINC